MSDVFKALYFMHFFFLKQRQSRIQRLFHHKVNTKSYLSRRTNTENEEALMLAVCHKISSSLFKWIAIHCPYGQQNSQQVSLLYPDVFIRSSLGK